jgi:hypothetical protein
MDWLEKLTFTRVAVALALMVGLRLGLPYWRYPVNWYTQWRYPPQGGPSAAGQDIMADAERREAGRIEARYRRILAQLEQARAQGFDTRALESKARAALELNTKAYRHSAARMLAEVEMSVPRPRVNYIPMGPTQAPGEDIEPDAPGKSAVAQDEAPAPAPKKKARRKRRAR